MSDSVPLVVFVVPWAAIAFDIYCLSELRRTKFVEILTKEQWVVAICLLTPFGGISFLMLGRSR